MSEAASSDVAEGQSMIPSHRSWVSRRGCPVRASGYQEPLDTLIPVVERLSKVALCEFQANLDNIMGSKSAKEGYMKSDHASKSK